MKFGEILDEWDSITSKPIHGKSSKRTIVASSHGRETPDDPELKPVIRKQSVNEGMQAWLHQHGVEHKDDILDRENEASCIEDSRRLSGMQPESSIDLHGLTAEEACARLHAFIESARIRGLEKVLVVHGKGNHSKDEPVLRNMVYRELDRIPCAGKRGEAPKRLGGSGAVWVLIRPS